MTYMSQSHEVNTNPQAPEQQVAALRIENEQLKLQNQALGDKLAELQNEVRQELAEMAERLSALGAMGSRLDTLVEQLGHTTVIAGLADNEQSQGSRAQASADADVSTTGAADNSPAHKKENWFKRKAAKFAAIGAMAVTAVVGGGIYVAAKDGVNDKAPKASFDLASFKDVNKKPHKSNTSAHAKTAFPSDNALRGASLNEAAKLIKSGSVADAKANVRKIADSPEISVSHAYNQQAHAAVNKEAITVQTAIEMVALSRHSDDGNVVTTYNNLHDRPLTSELPTSVGEARAWILNKMADEDTNYRLLKMSIPNSENAAQRNEHDVFSVRQNFSNVLFLEMTLENGKKALFKVGGGSDQSIGTCWNDVQGNPVSVREFVGTTVSTSQGQRTSTTNTTGGGNVNKPKPSKTTTTNQTGGERVVRVSPKKDDGRLPGNKNVPADQDKGTPDKAGKGPAGQTPDQSGYVPGESKPATPAQEPTPPPLPNQPAPTGPAQEGTPTPAPAEPANGSGTPAPTTDPNPQG